VFYLADGLGGIQALGADLGAVHDPATTEQAVGSFQLVEALGGGLVATVLQEAGGL